MSKLYTRHGMSKSPEYYSWDHIKRRCYNKNNQGYKWYGARGIKMCDRWLNSFTNFLEDIGPKPSPKHSVERDDTNGDYTPENCRWATTVEQANNRRGNRKISFNGVTKNVGQWAESLGIGSSTLIDRLNRGWPLEKALTGEYFDNKH